MWDTDGYECAFAFAFVRVIDRLCALTVLNEGFVFIPGGLLGARRSEWILSVVCRSSAIDRVVDAFVL